MTYKPRLSKELFDQDHYSVLEVQGENDYFAKRFNEISANEWVGGVRMGVTAILEVMLAELYNNPEIQKLLIKKDNE